MDPQIYANKPAATVLAAILGPRPELRYIRSNTLLRTSERQKIHADLRFRHPTHPFAVACNVCLIEASAESGSTEVWLGTQQFDLDSHETLQSSDIADEQIEKRRLVRPPIQPTLPKGSLVLRDLRLWWVEIGIGLTVGIAGGRTQRTMSVS